MAIQDMKVEFNSNNKRIIEKKHIWFLQMKNVISHIKTSRGVVPDADGQEEDRLSGLDHRVDRRAVETLKP